MRPFPTAPTAALKPDFLDAAEFNQAYRRANEDDSVYFPGVQAMFGVPKERRTYEPTALRMFRTIPQEMAADPLTVPVAAATIGAGATAGAGRALFRTGLTEALTAPGRKFVGTAAARGAQSGAKVAVQENLVEPFTTDQAINSALGSSAANVSPLRFLTNIPVHSDVLPGMTANKATDEDIWAGQQGWRHWSRQEAKRYAEAAGIPVPETTDPYARERKAANHVVPHPFPDQNPRDSGRRRLLGKKPLHTPIFSD